MDKRRFSRIKFDIEALLQNGDDVYEGHVSNLSLKGMYFEYNGLPPLSSGSNVLATIQLIGHSSSLQIDVKCEIVRLDDDGVALKFIELDMDSFMHLKNIVSYNDGDPEKIENEFRDFIKDQLSKNKE